MATPNLAAVQTMVPTNLASQQLSVTTAVAVYTVPASTSAIVKGVVICNTGAVANITVALVPSGGSNDGTHALVNLYALQPNDSLTLLPEDLAGGYMGAGDVLYITSSVASAVDVTVTGLTNT